MHMESISKVDLSPFSMLLTTALSYRRLVGRAWCHESSSANVSQTSVAVSYYKQKRTVYYCSSSFPHRTVDVRRHKLCFDNR